MVKKQTKSEKLIKKVRRNTRQVYNAEQKILIIYNLEDIYLRRQG
ncbi:hypothetical protein [Ornithobacterium rhinotracheale]|uniref:Uncharacterized protein n=1 Tax=Ornithobacterium rhinotracheale (strain ATCC 51463 / DSM 15997 / CCUG 23171 / CIP 104009 / LMG 9086) TaxID=867902 RepID=I4A3F8_ORNRL|nr:hypothetical protein [Ornithobacterium rhinotracheale]AFL98492.1 hypothetical protein Ornrh_2364 [Ornithobacterium rhinotracheale DSM 15997]AIQ00771.1 hypothetical protein Q785_11950 [Ornithobacterium rhinotracheale ORT-UMN 88]KGB65888.1 hypothetical protein Q787_11485 [Ornithobacterium rhinotracheale H06-030791]UVD87270.1 hypothetical protein NV236_11500 [Ornithobacterium rhinotracheale]